MKRLMAAVTLVAVFVLATPAPAMAEEKMLGTVTKIDVNGQGALATLKDAKTGGAVDITVTDEVTLAKFKDKRIGVGDEIKCKYEPKDGKNLSTYFKKAGGC